jgi:hypothetical protein
MKDIRIIEETSPSLIWDSKYGNKNFLAETAKEEQAFRIQNILNNDSNKVNEENKKKEDEKADEIETIK